MKLSVIMPIYNEEKTIRKILKKVKEVNIPKEIIVIDDHSTDSTPQMLEKEKAKNIQIIRQPRNMGKGMAICTALNYVTGDIVIIQDGDLEYDPQDYHALVKPILDGKAEVVYGSRVLRKDYKISYLRYALGGKFLTWLTNFLYHAGITDEPTGYKVFKTEVIKSLNLHSRRFDFCPEVTAKVCKKGYKIYEVPVAYCPRKMAEGKKIRWRDGLMAILALFKYRFLD